MAFSVKETERDRELTGSIPGEEEGGCGCCVSVFFDRRCVWMSSHLVVSLYREAEDAWIIDSACISVLATS